MTDNKFFTSRSAVEAANNCRRLRYIEYLMYGKGITPKRKTVPLVSGITVHAGVEVMLNQARLGQEINVEQAIEKAIVEYDDEVHEAGFAGTTFKNDKQQWFTYCEQKALVEALLRLWWLRELPRILARYKIIGVEREIEPLPLGNLIMWQTRVDAELQEIGSGDYHNYSLKTVAMWTAQSEKGYKQDLQGITEIWGVEEDNRRALTEWDGMRDSAEELLKRNIGGNNLLKIWEFLSKKKPLDKKVMGVSFCFLVKGKWRREDPSDEMSLRVTDCPLIRGYKNITASEVLYAHSWYFPNLANKSGKGALGKGWEKFNVWESDITIKQWIEVLHSGTIQPECGDILGAHCITPPEYFRDEDDIQETMEEIRLSEEKIAIAAESIERQEGKIRMGDLLEVFPRNRAHCYWHFGDECPYVPVCWDATVGSDIMGSGLYEIRKPHHTPEAKELERRERE